MQGVIRERVPELTAVLTIVSLGLVFGAALRVIPRSVLPSAPAAVFAAIPHINAVVSTLAILTILSGVTFARRGEYERHRAMMVTSLALFVIFLVLYLYKVSIQGPTAFSGPATIRTYVYLPLLTIHILLAIACIPLLYYVLLLAASRPIREVFDTAHSKAGRIAASLWLVSFLLGNVVYALLYVVY